MKTLSRQIGRRIKTIREKLDYTQGQFANLLGVSNRAISSYEQGDSNPSIKNLIKIAKIGEVSIDWLLTGGNMVHKPPPEEQEFTEDEIRLLIAYRKASKPRKEIALEILEKQSRQCIKNDQE